MPVTSNYYPILSHFLCVVEKTTGMPAQPLDAEPQQLQQLHDDRAADPPAKLPKGVVLGPDGKPCRTCSSSRSFASWASMAKAQAGGDTSATISATSSLAPAPPRDDCPPDVEALGRSSWTLLHALTASYPERPTPQHQVDARQLVSSLSRLYPCWTCADDFQRWLAEDANAPRVGSREEFGRWMCEAHNAVNGKLGKERFDCRRWEERWRTGWRDGSCD